MSAPVEEYKNGKTGPSEEEKIDSIVRLNIGTAGSNGVSPKTKPESKSQDEKTKREKKSAAERTSAKESANKVSISAASEQQQVSAATAQSKQSNNMSRRRNRINAGLATAEELEEKTRTDVGATPATPV